MISLRYWRERGWVAIDAPTYAQAWHCFGGSVATHPFFVESLSSLVGVKVRYLGRLSSGEIEAAVACWGRDLALSRRVLKRIGQRGAFDMGNAEIILPARDTAQAPLRHRGSFLSSLNQGRFAGLRLQKDELAMARPLEQFSRKFRYNQRRELRLFEEAGGQLQPMSGYSPHEQAAIYTDLFERRWGFDVPGKKNLAQVFETLRPFIFGSIAVLNNKPVAIQVLYRVEAPQWVSIEYVNGGVAPESRAFSPGSILSFANIQAAWADAESLGKTLRYSFGRADREYKERWCNRMECFEV